MSKWKPSREKRRELNARFRAANPEKSAEQRRVSMRLWRKRHPEEMKRRDRDARYRREYGITLVEYDQMLAEQGGVCAICKKEPDGRRLSVDHDHVTGEVRGLLCVRCNSFLGYYESSWRVEAERYLRGPVDAL